MRQKFLPSGLNSSDAQASHFALIDRLIAELTACRKSPSQELFRFLH